MTERTNSKLLVYDRGHCECWLSIVYLHVLRTDTKLRCRCRDWRQCKRKHCPSDHRCSRCCRTWSNNPPNFAPKATLASWSCGNVELPKRQSVEKKNTGKKKKKVLFRIELELAFQALQMNCLPMKMPNRNRSAFDSWPVSRNRECANRLLPERPRCWSANAWWNWMFSSIDDIRSSLWWIHCATCHLWSKENSLKKKFRNLMEYAIEWTKLRNRQEDEQKRLRNLTVFVHLEMKRSSAVGGSTFVVASDLFAIFDVDFAPILFFTIVQIIFFVFRFERFPFFVNDVFVHVVQHGGIDRGQSDAEHQGQDDSHFDCGRRRSRREKESGRKWAASANDHKRKKQTLCFKVRRDGSREEKQRALWRVQLVKRSRTNQNETKRTKEEERLWIGAVERLRFK